MSKKKKVYVWYSSATDFTGKNIADALGAECGSEDPLKKDYDIVICWGTKVKTNVILPTNKLILNDPNRIRVNRNKYNTLQLLNDANVNIGKFCAAGEIKNKLADGSLKFPMVARTTYHQGGKGLWLILNNAGVTKAIKYGASYFQDFMDVTDEYRLHIIDGTLLYVQKKVERNIEDINAAYVRINKEKIQYIAQKNNVTIDEPTIDYVLSKTCTDKWPNINVRSNGKGWKFSQISKVPEALLSIAVEALTTIGLDFGAVDCCTLHDGSVAIIEVNTGPGLEGTPFKTYIKKFKEIIDSKKTTKTSKATKTTKTTKANKDVIKELADSMDMLSQLLSGAETDAEVAVIRKLADKALKK